MFAHLLYVLKSHVINNKGSSSIERGGGEVMIKYSNHRE